VGRSLLAEGKDKEWDHGGGDQGSGAALAKEEKRTSTKGERREEADWWSRENRIQDRKTRSRGSGTKKRGE